MGVSNSKSRGLPLGVGGRVRLSLELKTQWQGNRYSDMGGPAFLVLKGCVHRPVVAYRIRLDLPFDCWFVEWGQLQRAASCPTTVGLCWGSREAASQGWRENKRP